LNAITPASAARLAVGSVTPRWRSASAIAEASEARLSSSRSRLALESAPAGSRLHGAADEGVPFRGIAEAIARRLNLAAASIPAEQADAHFGFLGGLVTLDNPTSSAVTRALLGWRPVHPGLLADLEEDHYFTTPGA